MVVPDSAVDTYLLLNMLTGRYKQYRQNKNKSHLLTSARKPHFLHFIL